MNAFNPTASPPADSPAVSFVKPLLVSLGLAATLTGVSAWAIAQLPDGVRIPVHWNMAGQADRFGGPSALWLTPGMVAGLSLLLYLAPKVEPRRGHLQRSARAYSWAWLTIVSFLAGLHLLMVRAALGHRVPMDRWITAGVGLLFLVVGNFLGKIRSNFIFGFRTPWTLSSELSWNRTHRLAGWLFVIGGGVLVIAATAGLGGKALVAALAACLTTMVAVPAVYSYWVWRYDPERRAASLFRPPANGSDPPHPAD